jgi:hypothetical protein
LKKYKYYLFGLLFFLGFSLILSRYTRHANMGETHIFLESINNSASFSGWLENSIEGTTHFAYHNSPGFLLFVPLVWIFGDFSSHLIFAFNSLALLITNYFSSVIFNRNKQFFGIGFILFIALFLSAFTQHAKLIDTRFSALGLCLFLVGLLLEKRPIFLIGFLLTLLFRETTVLTCVSILVFSRKFPFGVSLKKRIIGTGAFWFFFSIILIHFLQPNGISLGNGAMNRLDYNVYNDLGLKLSYFLRILSFGPLVIFSTPGLAGLFFELIFPIFSKDYVLYNITWHYWMPAVTISFIYGYWILKEKFSQNTEIFKGYSIFVINTCIWQFLTTFHPRLY